MINLTIVDGNNWFRRRAETDIMGLPVRKCFQEIQGNSEHVIVVWDGMNANARRRAIYPDYKVKRITPGEDIFKSQDLLKRLLVLGKASQVQVDGYEGDDVVAALALYYKDKVDNIFIESNDADLGQLGFPMSRATPLPEKPEFIAIYKAIVGDASDNIPGAKGFGKGSWEKLTDAQKRMLHHVVANCINETETVIKAKVEAFFPPKALTWFVKKENRMQVLDFYRIVNFLPIPMSVIQSNTRVGLNVPGEALQILEEYFI